MSRIGEFPRSFKGFASLAATAESTSMSLIKSASSAGLRRRTIPSVIIAAVFQKNGFAVIILM